MAQPFHLLLFFAVTASLAGRDVTVRLYSNDPKRAGEQVSKFRTHLGESLPQLVLQLG